MGKKDVSEDSSSAVNDVESQLKDVFAKRKEEIEKKLEEIVKKESKAKEEIGSMDKEFIKGKEYLIDYKKTLSEFKDNQSDIRKQINDILTQVIELQDQMKSMTDQTLEMLKKAGDLTNKLEEIRKGTIEKTDYIKKELEESYGVSPEFPENLRNGNIDLGEDLSNISKIRELLGTNHFKEIVNKNEEEYVREEKQEEEEAELEEETGKVEITQEEEVEAEEAEVKKEAVEGKQKYEDKFKILEKYLKSEKSDDNGEISYFEKDGKIILDGKSIISAIDDCIEKSKKLYTDLDEAGSPKDQFFIKQEIIMSQESLRQIMLKCLMMCKNESCSLPDYTDDILNVNVFKDILKRISIENWSNEEDFTSFDEYFSEIKKAYYDHITPQDSYLQSIMDGLGIE